MNMQIFILDKYDLKGHLKVTKVHPILALTKPFPYWKVCWCFTLQIVSISLSHSHILLSSPIFLSLSISLFRSMQKLTYTQL